ncbi:MAG: hypothetical protein LCI00_13150 [Chloroflexi bacterium]|nr:hypothetical protein [Chloroflexota bacterium]
MLEFATTVTLTGPALPDFYVQYELENKLKGVLPSTARAKETWPALRKSLRQPMTEISGHIRVRNVVFEPLMPIMGYGTPKSAGKVRTRENDEDGGVLYSDAEGGILRCWTYDYNTDLDAPLARGFTSRYTPQRIAERVLLTTGERIGLLTNGIELRLIISEAARVASCVIVDLNALKQFDPKTPPDAFRLIVALASPEGIQRLEDILDDARLKQSKVTGELRKQAREAVEGFVQGILDHPDNYERLEAEFLHIMEVQGCDEADAKALLAKRLWRESLIVVYRILFILSGEAGTRERPSFSFSSGSIWRNTYSPSAALGRIAQKALESGADTGRFLEDGLHALFRFFESGISSTELNISPLGGVLFGVDAAPLVDALAWGEHGCAVLLDKLLRAPRGKGRARTLVRLSYRDLDVEELGRVYEALLELDPGITSENMVRLRRQKLEVVVPAAQGEKYRAAVATEDDDEADDEPEDDEDDGKKGKIKWIEAIGGPNEAHPIGRFFLRVGLGRKSSGSYYTPESFVKFLVQETLAPQCDALSPKDDPQPRAILTLNVLDPAMGSGHFLVGACRFLGERLYEACRTAAEKGLWERIPEEVAAYLPGRVLEGASEAGLSADRARAICKRLVVVNCLYGVDKNPLAVELAKVALWLESFAEGLPLTFLDHRLVLGDSLLGPLKIAEGGHDSPLLPPYATTPLDMLLAQKARESLKERLTEALVIVQELDGTIGLDPADIAHKAEAKARLDAALRPFVELCQAWSGGVMLGEKEVDTEAYNAALAMLGDGTWEADDLPPNIQKLLAKGQEAGVLTYPLAFPEVFFPTGDPKEFYGFDTILGNPPWDKLRVERREVLASFDVGFLFGKESAGHGSEHELLEKTFLEFPEAVAYENSIIGTRETIHYLFALDELSSMVLNASGDIDLYRVFLLNSALWINRNGRVGIIVGGGFIKNPTESPLRRYLFERLHPVFVGHFLNLKQLFQGPSTRISFCLINAVGLTVKTDLWFRLGFDLTSFSDLTDTTDSVIDSVEFPLYKQAVLERGEILQLSKNLPERKASDTNALSFLEAENIQLGTDLNRTLAKPILVSISKLFPTKNDAREPDVINAAIKLGYSPSYTSKSLEQYNSIPRAKSGKWTPEVDLLVDLSSPKAQNLLPNIPYFRAALRATCGHPKTNARSLMLTLLPPGTSSTNSIMIEVQPHKRANVNALYVCGVLNTFSIDHRVRMRVQANINKGILKNVEIPELNDDLRSFFVHSALRLICNHEGYLPLWQEQLGDVWREPKPKHTFPVLDGETERWDVRAAIDVVVAQAYGLNRDQYEHVLRSFDRASGPNPYTGICLEKWDELHAIGLEAFTRKYDPYHDIPLVETLPKPVIDLKLPQNDSKDVPRDLFGDPLPTNIFGEVIHPGDKKKKR